MLGLQAPPLPESRCLDCQAAGPPLPESRWLGLPFQGLPFPLRGGFLCICFSINPTGLGVNAPPPNFAPAQSPEPRPLLCPGDAARRDSGAGSVAPALPTRPAGRACACAAHAPARHRVRASPRFHGRDEHPVPPTNARLRGLETRHTSTAMAELKCVGPIVVGGWLVEGAGRGRAGGTSGSWRRTYVRRGLGMSRVRDTPCAASRAPAHPLPRCSLALLAGCGSAGCRSAQAKVRFSDANPPPHTTRPSP